MLLSIAVTEASAQGLEVMRVPSSSGAADAGIRVGDMLFEWRAADASGSLVSPLQLQQLDTEQVHGGALTITGRRAGTLVTWRVGPRPMSMESRPVLSPGEQAAMAAASARARSGDPRGAAADISRAAAELASAGRRIPAIEYYLAAATFAATGAAWDDVDTAFASAVRTAGDERLPVAPIRRAAAEAHERAQRWAAAESHYRAALDADSPGTLSFAATLEAFGVLRARRGDVASAVTQFERALQIRLQEAPGSLAVAESANDLGLAERTRGNLDRALELQTQALGIRQRLVPASVDLAVSHVNIGLVHADRGALALAESEYTEARRLFEAHAPGSSFLATTLNNLGLVVMARGDFEAAEPPLSQALGLRRALNPASLDVAGSLHNLAVLYHRRGDLGLVEPSLREALQLKERFAPDSLTLTQSLDLLAIVTRDSGRLDEAQNIALRALDIRRRVAPEHPAVAGGLVAMGIIAMMQDRLPMAEDWFRQAVDFLSRVAPDSLDLASAHRNLGHVAHLRGAWAAATSAYARSRAITQRLAPGSLADAASLHGLALAAWRQDDARTAERTFADAIAALETQTTRLGSTVEGQLTFGGSAYEIYHDYVDFLASQDRPDAAFTVLERGRARVLRQLIATHASADAGAVGSAAPSLAEVFDARQAGSLLKRGEALVAYSFGERDTLIFVVRNGRPTVSRKVPVAGAVLSARIAAFRESIGADQIDEADVRAVGKALYEWLVQPVEAELLTAERLLILPDGPLRVLPFAALVRGDEFLVQWKPLYFGASATLQADLQKRTGPRPAAESPVVAFGDPFPLPDTTDRRLAALQPLPGSRREARDITELLEVRTAPHIGAAATEARARAALTQGRYVHFAVHAVADENAPLQSALILSPSTPTSGAQTDGLLHAGEIIAEVRATASMVVLSGCETAMGRNARGEGILGLTSAFHVAGVPTVVASLWKVDDSSTATLMIAFYRHLKSGLAKDDALRRAQQELIASSATRNAYHWAAFTVSGLRD